MSEMYEKLMKCLESVRAKTDFQPKVALVLGSGLGNYGEQIQVEATVDYHDIESFPVSTVPGHKGRFIFGYVGKVPVVCMQGRIHYYEGYPISDVVLPTRLMKLLGAEILFVTNAAGGINYNFKAGDLMLIRDHISDFVPSPLIGSNVEELGLRFPDMSHVYDEDLQEIIRETAREEKILLREGVYVQTTGPNFETPTEVRMFRLLGGDAVGMSTAVEALAANHMGMKICGVSCISNQAAGMTLEPLSDDDVKVVAQKSGVTFQRLVTASIEKMGK